VTAVAESAARWVLLADGRAHLLAGDRPGGVLVARCGHSLSRGVLQHERLPSRYLCETCFCVYLLPESVFSRTPAGRRLSEAPDSAPGGQSAPESVSLRARQQVLRTPIVTALEGI
jgi:hypothetical protein